MKNLLIIFLFILSNISIASTCSLPSGENLVIGCATKCDWSTKRALQKISSKLGYKLELVDMPKRAMNQSYETIDGIVIPGGEDIDPIHYKYEVEEELRRRIEDLDHLVDYTREGAKRDKFELEMLKNYFQDQENENLPLLGICRGMQIITVSQKIPLYIDIKAELGIANRRNLKDRITITDSTSLIQNLLETVSFRAYKNHHQGLRVDYFKKYQKTRWPHLNVTAYSNNDLIAEALEFKNRPVLGVQFHPEVDNGSLREKIFSWVLKKSCQNKLLKLSH